KLGPLPLRLAITANVYFRFPAAMRGDWQGKRLGLIQYRRATTLDASSYQPQAGGEEVSDAARAKSAQSLAWAAAALLLTPLGDQISRLSANGDQSLEATNSKTNASVGLRLRADYSLDTAQTRCVNPATGHEQTLMLRTSTSLIPLGDLNVPASIS